MRCLRIGVRRGERRCRSAHECSQCFPECSFWSIKPRECYRSNLVVSEDLRLSFKRMNTCHKTKAPRAILRNTPSDLSVSMTNQTRKHVHSAKKEYPMIHKAVVNLCFMRSTSKSSIHE